MFDLAKNRELYKPIDLGEIHNILKYFAKDKCLGPDG